MLHTGPADLHTVKGWSCSRYNLAMQRSATFAEERGRGKRRRRMKSRKWQIKGVRDNTNINFVGKIKNVASSFCIAWKQNTSTSCHKNAVAN